MIKLLILSNYDVCLGSCQGQDLRLKPVFLSLPDNCGHKLVQALRLKCETQTDSVGIQKYFGMKILIYFISKHSPPQRLFVLNHKGSCFHVAKLVGESERKSLQEEIAESIMLECLLDFCSLD